MTDAQSKPLGEINIFKQRLAFPALWTPTSVKPTKENPNPTKQFSATFLVPKGSKTEAMINDTIMKVATEKWKKDAKEIVESVINNKNLSCWMNGDGIEKRKLDGFPGHMALTAKNKRRPTVLDNTGATTTEEDGIVYAGCMVNAQVEIWAQENTHGKAIRCSLLGVVFAGKGDAFGGGRVASAEDLQSLATGDDDEASLLGDE